MAPDTKTPVKPKLVLVGAGAIGTVMATEAVRRELADVVIIDVVEGLAEGRALDISHCCVIVGSTSRIRGTSDMSEIEGADVIIVTAGRARGGPPDAAWSRDQLLQCNSEIIGGIGEKIGQLAPKSFVICITNPLDVMVKLIQEKSGLPKNKVVGMGGILDSARFRGLTATALNVAPNDVQGLVIGSHGDAMVPVIDSLSVNGIPIAHFVNANKITQKQLENIKQQTITAGSRIADLLKNGTASVAPANAALAMAEAYLRDQKRVFPVCVWADGHYGIKNLYAGLPVVLGKNGVEGVVPLELSPRDLDALTASAAVTQKLVNKLM